jgi:hypothetical protein
LKLENEIIVETIGGQYLRLRPEADDISLSGEFDGGPLSAVSGISNPSPPKIDTLPRAE